MIWVENIKKNQNFREQVKFSNRIEALIQKIYTFSIIGYIRLTLIGIFISSVHNLYH